MYRTRIEACTGLDSLPQPEKLPEIDPEKDPEVARAHASARAPAREAESESESASTADEDESTRTSQRGQRASARPVTGLLLFESVVRDATGVGPDIGALREWWRRASAEWERLERPPSELDGEVRAFGRWLADQPERKRDQVVPHMRFRDHLGRWARLAAGPTPEVDWAAQARLAASDAADLLDDVPPTSGGRPWGRESTTHAGGRSATGKRATIPRAEPASDEEFARLAAELEAAEADERADGKAACST